MTTPVFSLAMPSGDSFDLNTAELLLVLGLLLLYLELLKATRSGSASVVDHVLSMALFVVALLFKYAALTDEEEVQAKMSIEQREAYETPLYLSFVAMIAVVGALLAAVILLLGKRAEVKGTFNRVFRDPISGLLNRQRFEAVQARILAQGTQPEPEAEAKPADDAESAAAPHGASVKQR